MAKGTIELDSAVLKNESTAIIQFHCNCKSGYSIKLRDDIAPSEQWSGSVRMYYSTTPTVTKDSDKITVQMYLDGINQNTVYVPGRGYVTTFEWTLPVSGKTYYIQLRMQLYEDDENEPYTYEVGHYSSHKAPPAPSGLINADQRPQHDFGKLDQPLFGVAMYYDKQTQAEDEGNEDVWKKDFVDFTQCIELPSYDVNYEDVNEDWEDANYFTHRIRVKQKIVGKMNLRFSNLKEYNTFMTLIKQSRERNGKGRAYVELEVQVNDDIDEYTNDDIALQRCYVKQGFFFIKISSNPWVAPVFGHYDRYQAISLSITEA